MQIPTKAEVKRRLGITSDAELARLFGITGAAVHYWPDDEPIRRSRWLELKHELRPDIFGDRPVEAA